MVTKIDNSQASKVTEEELKLYLALKPYIFRCLTLNHDINNPLAGILGYCEFLLEESKSFSKEQVSYLNQIATCADRIKNEIETLCMEKIKLSENIDFEEATNFFEEFSSKASD